MGCSTALVVKGPTLDIVVAISDRTREDDPREVAIGIWISPRSWLARLVRSRRGTQDPDLHKVLDLAEGFVRSNGGANLRWSER